jgi:hypothetical protein
VHGFFAERIFGPDRRDLLAIQLASHAAPQKHQTAPASAPTHCPRRSATSNGGSAP